MLKMNLKTEIKPVRYYFLIRVKNDK